MANTSGQSQIRGIDIDKLLKGFADEEFIFKQYCNVSSTSARKIIWYQKTAGALDSTDTTGITASQIANAAPGARPVVVEPSFTQNTSYVRKYFVESPFFSEEDIKDTDVDVMATALRDLLRAVANQVDARIYDILSESQSAVNILTTGSTAAWDAASGQDPVKDILVSRRKIRAQGYNTKGAVLLCQPFDVQNLIVWLITTKGASIPTFASQLVQDATILEIVGVRIVESQNVVADSVTMLIPQRSITWKNFTEMTSAVIDDQGIGKKVRIWAEGEALLTDPKSVHLITNTQA